MKNSIRLKGVFGYTGIPNILTESLLSRGIQKIQKTQLYYLSDVMSYKRLQSLAIGAI